MRFNKEYLLILVYLLSITAANILIHYLGPEFSIITAFLFIGFDLTSRDFLHEIWGKYRLPKMMLLFLSGSVISFLLNSGVYNIAVASFISFMLSGVVDYISYSVSKQLGIPKAPRMNVSNIFSSAVDSLIFPVLAFGFPVLWAVVLGQFAAKVVGGYLWVGVINALFIPKN